jgi:hypothetical protein
MNAKIVENTGKSIFDYLYSILYILIPLATLGLHSFSRDVFVLSMEFFQIENATLFLCYLSITYGIFWIADRFFSKELNIAWLSGLSAILSLFILFFENPVSFWIGAVITIPFILFLFVSEGRYIPNLRFGMFGTDQFIEVIILATIAFSTSNQLVALFAISFLLVNLLFVRSIEAWEVTIYRFGKQVRQKRFKSASTSSSYSAYFLIIPLLEKVKWA